MHWLSSSIWSKQSLVAFTLLAATFLSGCTTSANHHDVEFAGDIEIQNGQFVMDGNVSVSIGAAPDTTFRNISVVLYNDHKEVIRRSSVGDLSTHGPPQSQPINLTTDTIPSYVVIESRDFWQSDTDVYVSGYKRSSNEDRYEEYSRHRANEKFPDDTS